MPKYQLRRFTESGIDLAIQGLERVAAGEKFDLVTLLEDDRFTEKITRERVVEVVRFANRMDCGEYFCRLLETNKNALGLNPETDKGLWTWLALLWSDQLLSNAGDPVGKLYRWVPSMSFRHYYRHLLAGPYFVYKAHSDNPARAWALLCTEPYAPGEVYEQIVSYRNMVRFPSIVETVTRLYFDPARGRLKRGSAGKSGGSARRFAAVLGQFELTYDFYGMEAEEILALLPSEFDRFRDA